MIDRYLLLAWAVVLVARAVVVILSSVTSIVVLGATAIVHLAHFFNGIVVWFFPLSSRKDADDAIGKV